jgi:chorismate mutase
VRRYTSPEEHSFFPEHLPEPILPPLKYPRLLVENSVNMNAQILSRYINEIVPAICKSGDDEQHGSSVLCDIATLQAISKRIHLGKFVAETKYQVSQWVDPTLNALS